MSVVGRLILLFGMLWMTEAVAAQERNLNGEIMVVPELPSAPVLTTDDYPGCREDWQKLEAPFDRANDTKRCTSLLDRYYGQKLLPFAEAMIAHQDELTRLYTENVVGNGTLTPAVQQDFYNRMQAEFAASQPDGTNMADYRAVIARYNEDRAYLQDRFCFNTGCNGYPVPEYSPPETDAQIAAKQDKKNRLASSKKCGKARKRGGFLGGLVGGIAGQAAGLDGIGTLLAAGASAVLVGEIACQLTREEQEEAIKATQKVTEEEKVGATANWKSPTREGVSGSSTVTELVSRPNGRRCMTITDIAIIDGEETRIEKQMCKSRGEKAYILEA